MIVCFPFRYRLAPEHRFPSGLDDCLLVSRELFQNSEHYQVNPSRIILSGDSAGGNLALVVSHLLIQDKYQPYSLCLLYPSLQFLDFTLPSYRTYLKQNILGVLNEDNLVLMISLLTEKKTTITKDILVNSHVAAEDQKNLYPFMNPTKYLSIPHDMNDTRERNENLVKDLKYLISPSMSPLLVSDDQLNQLPPILLFTTEYDILRDEGRTHANHFETCLKFFVCFRFYICFSITVIEQDYLSPPF